MSFISNFKSKNPSLAFLDFRKYLSVRFLVIFALNMQSTTIYYWIYDLTGDELKLGLVGLAEVIPAVLFSLVSGHFIDKNEKRNMLLYCVIAYVLIGVGLYMFTLDSTQVNYSQKEVLWGIYGLVFLGGMVRAFVGASSFALMGTLVPKKLYPNATSWTAMFWQLGSVLGPLTAGVLIATYSTSASMFAVVIFLVLSVVMLLVIPKQPLIKSAAKEPILSRLSEGLRFVYKTRPLLGALVLDLFSVLFGGAVALLPVFQKDILMVDETGYGILRAAPGVGAIITLVFLTFIPLRKNPGLKLFICVGCFGLSIILFGLSKNFYLSVFALTCTGLFDAVSVVIRSTILQLVTPEHMRGRVAAVNTMFISSSNELGDFESGVMAHWLGPVRAVVVGGSLTIGVVAVTYMKFKQLRTFQYDESD